MMSEQDRDQKTESATPQRIRKSREDGQLGFSGELIGGVILTVGVLYFWFASNSFFGAIENVLRNRTTCFDPMIENPATIAGAIGEDVKIVGYACLALILPLFIVSFLIGALQTEFNFSIKPLNLKWEKLSVPAGVKRIFSSSSLVRVALSIAKATIVVVIILLITRSKLGDIGGSVHASFQDLMFLLCRITLYISLAIASTMTLIGIIDLVFQKWKHLEDIKMSIRDLRDEHKENEGDPLIKARIRRLQAESGRQRTLEKIPQASVIITNPTHFAVAVQYDRDSMAAPIVIAKGADFLAKKIIEAGKQNNIPVVERKPVARFLYFNVKPGQPVPYELYQAVAEILTFVDRVKKAA